MKIESVLFSEIPKQDILVWRACANSQPLINPLNDPDYFACLAHAGMDTHLLVARESPYSLYWPYQIQSHKGSQPAVKKISDCSQLVISPEAKIDPSSILRSAGLTFYEFDHLFEQTSFDVAPFAYYADPCYLIDISNGREEYLSDLATKGSKVAREARRKRNKMERELGAVRLEPASSDPADLRLLLDWKIEQLEQQGFGHCFREEWTLKFMQRHLAFQSANCQGKLSVLYAGDEKVAMHYGSWGTTAINSWIPAVNPMHAKHSPALCLYMNLIPEAESSGIQTIILGRGENQTKTRLANKTVNNYVGRITTTLFGKTRIWGMKGLYRSLHSRWGNYLRDSVRRMRKRSHR